MHFFSTNYDLLVRLIAKTKKLLKHRNDPEDKICIMYLIGYDTCWFLSLAFTHSRQIPFRLKVYIQRYLHAELLSYVIENKILELFL